MVIAGLGDSNTQTGWPTPDVYRWVEYAAQMAPQHTWRNYGAGGATVCDPGIAWPWAIPQLDAALADGATHVVAAFGTNDARLGKSRDQIIEAYCAFREHALQGGAAPLIATVPQTSPAHATIAAVNQRLLLLEKSFGWQLVDFDVGSPVNELEADGVHVTDDAQHERARRVVLALT